MRVALLLISCLLLGLLPGDAFCQKNKKKNEEAGRPRIMATYGDSLRTDSVVIYETEIGYVMPNYSEKFIGRWAINVMRRQARAQPDSLVNAVFEFIDDTTFNAFVGCNKLTGTYTIKGPTIKFHVLSPPIDPCATDIETWFIKLIQDRVSYFGIDEKILYLKDVAYNIVFDCAKTPVKESR